MEQLVRRFEQGADLDDVARIWRDVRWIDDAAEKKAALARLLELGSAEVALIDGSAECLAHWTPGSIHYQDTPLSLCAVTAVTTSLVGRKLGLASRLTARALEQGREAGHAVAALGMFEQGFYDRLGFGTAAYDHEVSFDPASLDVDHVEYRTPQRLTAHDSADMHAALLRRRRSHGAIDLDPPGYMAAELGFMDDVVALGYRDEAGTLTHFVCGTLAEQYGPLRISFLSYETTDQLLELLRLLRELGDQVRSVKLIEPAHVQLQVLIREPIRQRDRSRSTVHESWTRAIAWWQLRILDLEPCVAARRWVGPEVSFNLSLSDPIGAHLDSGWSGVAGDYTVSVNAASFVTRGHSQGLPLLEADVGSFSRLWFGVAAPTTLATTDQLLAGPQLLEQLDEALLLPPLVPGWDF